MSPALAGGFLSTGATGKSLKDGSFSSCYLGTDELIMIIQFAYFFHFFFFKNLEVTPLPPSLHIVSDLFIFSAIKWYRLGEGGKFRTVSFVAVLQFWLESYMRRHFG